MTEAKALIPPKIESLTFTAVVAVDSPPTLKRGLRTDGNKIQNDRLPEQFTENKSRLQFGHAEAYSFFILAFGFLIHALVEGPIFWISFPGLRFRIYLFNGRICGSSKSCIRCFERFSN